VDPNVVGHSRSPTIQPPRLIIRDARCLSALRVLKGMERGEVVKVVNETSVPARNPQIGGISEQTDAGVISSQPSIRNSSMQPPFLIRTWLGFVIYINDAT